jgi:hypothetical protein
MNEEVPEYEFLQSEWNLEQMIYVVVLVGLLRLIIFFDSRTKVLLYHFPQADLLNGCILVLLSLDLSELLLKNQRV